MYSPLHIQMIQVQQEEIAARAIRRHEVQEVRAATPCDRRTRRRLGKASRTATAA